MSSLFLRERFIGLHKWRAGNRNGSSLRRQLRKSCNVRPRLESLEARQLMAADLRENPSNVDAILEWNSVMLAANAADHSLASPEQGGPVLTGRAFAIVSAAMYDAYNSVEKIGESYLVRAPQASGANSDAAVAQAAHDTLVALYPSQADRFDTALAKTLARIPDSAWETRGTAVGAYVAERILASRAGDGTAEIMEPGYTPNGLPGFHDVDPLHVGQGFYASGAGNVDPFAVDDIADFTARPLDDGTPEGRMAFLQSDQYTAAYNEVLALGGDGEHWPTERTAEQTTIGIFWAYDGRPGIGTPPRMFNQIVQTIARQEHNTEAENARLFALVNIAMADAGIAAWTTKYDTAFWRPIMGIRGGASDGNPETVPHPDWTPLCSPASNPRLGETGFTPNFPAYTSGHASFGAAAFQILTRYYGRDDISFSVTSDEFNGATLGADRTVRPVVQRTFDSFSQAKFENAESRIYLGVHWAFDRDEGLAQGDKVANYVFEHALQADSRVSSQLQHNNLDPEDVNDDGLCTPLDALVIINEMNAQRTIPSEQFVDVNGDGSRSPADALMVINRLNSRPLGSAEGEAAAPLLAPFITGVRPLDENTRGSATSDARGREFALSTELISDFGGRTPSASSAGPFMSTRKPQPAAESHASLTQVGEGVDARTAVIDSFFADVEDE